MSIIQNVNIKQNVLGDDNNSVLDGITQIAALATWTGVSTSTLGIAGIQVNLKADKNCTVYIDQSMNGTNWDIVDSYTYYYTRGGQSWTTQATASYYRIRVTNNDKVNPTTTFRLQTALCPIVEAIPRTLSPNGDLKVAVYDIEDTDGHRVGVSPMNELRVSEHVRLVGASFGTTFDANFWSKAVQTGNSDATVNNNVLTLTTGSPTADGNILVQSVRKARYIPSYPNYYRGQVQCPAITPANLRRWGAFDTNDGFFFEWDGTNLAVVCRKGASDTNKVYSGSFNGLTGTDYSLDTNNHTYEIQWTNGSASFYIDGLLLHSFSGSTTPLTNTLSFNVGLQCVNSGGNTTANLLYVRSSSINRIGKQTATPQWKYQAGAAAGQVLKYGAGTLHRVTVNAWANGSTILLYDALTATNPIALITCTGNVQQPFTLTYDLDFYTGLTYTTTNATTNVTIVYE